MQSFWKRTPSVDPARVEALDKALGRVEKALEAIQTAIPQPYDDRAVMKALDDQDERMDALRLAVAEGIERVDRSERRIAQVVRRARERYEGDPGVEAEHAELEQAGQLRFFDGEGSRGGGMQPMPAPMAGRRLDLTPFPGRISEAEIEAIIQRRGG
jgi:hypothetical protein